MNVAWGGGGGFDGQPGTGMIGGEWPSAKTMGIGALQGATSALSIISQLGQKTSSGSNARAYAMQAQEDLKAIPQFQIAGQNQALGLRQKYLDAMSGNLTQAAAGGVDVGQGIVQDTNSALGDRVVSAARLVQNNVDMQATRARINSIANSMRALEAQKAQEDAEREQKRARLMGAIGQGLSGGLSMARMFL